jgi:GSH-dependent disulfide-bond oxidoreductase
MIDVYAWRTTNGLRATIAMAECGLPHRVIPIDVGAGANKAADYLRVNPSAQIPAIVDPDGPGGQPLVLAQSGAIVLYACQKSGRHIPSDAADYFRAMQWCMQAASDIAGTSAAMNQVENVAPEKVPSTIELFHKRFLRYFGIAEKQLQGRDYLAGSASFADFMLYPNYALRRNALPASDFPALAAWGDRMATRAGVQEGMRLYTEK